MVEARQWKCLSRFICALSLLTIAGCTPLYLWDTHVTSSPSPAPPEAPDLAREPVATLAPIAPAGLQGFTPFLSRALIAALSEASPSIRGIPTYETMNVINGQGLTGDYADLISGFNRSGILDGDRLRRFGSALGSRYVLLPGIADFSQALVDRFEIVGFKIVRNRIITLRLWLQLWDTQSGQILWESTGEITAASDLVRAERVVPLDEIGQKLWLRMIQDDLLNGKSKSRLFFRN